jgi:hypothetical protein
MDDGWHIYVGDRLAGHLDRTGNPAASTTAHRILPSPEPRSSR